MSKDAQSVVTEALALSLFASALSGGKSPDSRFQCFKTKFWDLAQAQLNGVDAHLDFCAMLEKFVPGDWRLRELGSMVSRVGAASDPTLIEMARQLFEQADIQPTALPDASLDIPAAPLSSTMRNDAARDVNIDQTNTVYNGASFAPGSYSGSARHDGPTFVNNLASVDVLNQAQKITNTINLRKSESGS